ncbi:helix-turn-helix domain-containing protein [Massilibacteroides sp.]|uniref:helix-turn-helix domain-containing protein n=1 Tax=Massilibacteroides sp. TaxID=2034766 RepID=UPI002629CE1A|nr:helix-turn-helix domain-containing protein [Massilibacteroides sp.]MDD4514633.1 helix-turn-helix domain-containing protein [Massilibacteroides sp.]
MEVITIESKAYKDIVSKIDEISRYVKEHSESQHEGWIDNHDVCKYLNISTRTLQRLRSQKLINFSIIRGKTYYKLSEIERMLDENLIKSSPQGFQELLDNYYKNAK